MKLLTALWGLIVDDSRLAWGIVLSLLISWGISVAGHSLEAGLMIWGGMIVTLWISIHHQLRMKILKEKPSGKP